LPIVDRPRVHRKKWKPRERWWEAAFPPAETLIEFLKASVPVCRSADVSFEKADGAYDAVAGPINDNNGRFKCASGISFSQ
jgi:hypothetical protein